MADLKVSRGDVIKLINIYKLNECLWNYKSAKYKRIDLKNKAWLEIAKQFNSNAIDIKKKVKHLRTAFVNEKKKVAASRKSGASAEIYEPCLFYYDEFKFLDNTIVLRKRSTNHNNFTENDSPDYFEQIVEENSTKANSSAEVEIAFEAFKEFEDEDICESTRIDIMPYTSTSKISSNAEVTAKTELCSPIVHRSTAKRTPKTTKDTSAMKAATSKIVATYEDAMAAIAGEEKEHEDAFASFGKSIAHRLRNFPPLISAEAMVDLETVMLKHTKKYHSSSRINILGNKVIRQPSVSNSTSDASMSASTSCSAPLTPGAESGGSWRSGFHYDILQEAMNDANL